MPARGGLPLPPPQPLLQRTPRAQAPGHHLPGSCCLMPVPPGNASEPSQLGGTKGKALTGERWRPGGRPAVSLCQRVQTERRLQAKVGRRRRLGRNGQLAARPAAWARRAARMPAAYPASRISRIMRRPGSSRSLGGVAGLLSAILLQRGTCCNSGRAQHRWGSGCDALPRARTGGSGRYLGLRLPPASAAAAAAAWWLAGLQAGCLTACHRIFCSS